MSSTVIIGTDTILGVIGDMCRRGVISGEAYAQCIRRNNRIEEELKKDVMIIR